MKEINSNKFNNVKQKTLIYAIIIDLIGMLSYLMPAAGEIIDFIWAPISGFLIFLLFRNKLGIIGGAAGFIEELMPQTDIIPTATILWFIKFVIKKKQTSKKIG
ncbi:MAG: hypothetical protein L3J74_18805 [Bacteroidales bacterium]|nr:hypothetical protein [Bacteroidales bacterium]